VVGVRLEHRDPLLEVTFAKEDLLVACYPWNELPKASVRGTDQDLGKICDTGGWGRYGLSTSKKS
jgi:hypothetical protein